MEAEKLKQLLEMGHHVEVKDKEWEKFKFISLHDRWWFIHEYGRFTSITIDQTFTNEYKIVTKAPKRLKEWDKVRILENVREIIDNEERKRTEIENMIWNVYKIESIAYLCTHYIIEWIAFPTRAVAPDWEEEEKDSLPTTEQSIDQLNVLFQWLSNRIDELENHHNTRLYYPKERSKHHKRQPVG